MFHRHPHWGICNPTPPTLGAPTPPGYSAEAQQFLDRLDSDPGIPRKNLYAALIDTLVAEGAWAEVDVIGVYAADTEANALIELKSGVYTPTVVGTLTFTADEGFTFPGSTTDYIDLVMPIASDASTHYTRDAASIGVWVLADCVNAPAVDLFVYSIGPTNIYPNYSGAATVRVNDDSPLMGVYAVTDGLGFTFGARTTSTNRTLYKDGVLLGTESVPSLALDPLTTSERLTVGCGSSAGTQVAAVVVGGNLDAVQVEIFSALWTYLTGVGAI